MKTVNLISLISILTIVYYIIGVSTSLDLVDAQTPTIQIFLQLLVMNQLLIWV